MNDQNALTLSEQIDSLVAENRHLRIKSDADDRTIHLLKEQYAGLSAQVKGMREDAIREVERARHQRDAAVQDMEIERDEALAANSQIEALLLQATEIITQALRARIGNATPEKMPPAQLGEVNDARLPAPTLS